MFHNHAEIPSQYVGGKTPKADQPSSEKNLSDYTLTFTHTENIHFPMSALYFLWHSL